MTNIVSYLIIDNATEDDEGLYTCTAFSNPLLSSQMDRMVSHSLTLHVVAGKNVMLRMKEYLSIVLTFSRNN